MIVQTRACIYGTKIYLKWWKRPYNCLTRGSFTAQFWVHPDGQQLAIPGLTTVSQIRGRFKLILPSMTLFQRRAGPNFYRVIFWKWSKPWVNCCQCELRVRVQMTTECHLFYSLKLVIYMLSICVYVCFCVLANRKTLYHKLLSRPSETVAMVT